MVAPALMPRRFERSLEWALRSRLRLAEGLRGERVAKLQTLFEKLLSWFRTRQGLSRMLRTRRALSLTNLGGPEVCW